MENLMLVEFIMCVISFGSTALFFRDAPPTAPSQSTHLKNQVSPLLLWVVQFGGITAWLVVISAVYRDSALLSCHLSRITCECVR
jgi:hypothetical protein